MRRFILIVLLFELNLPNAHAMRCIDLLSKREVIHMSRMYSIIEKSKQNLEAMRDLGLITEKQYNHYKEDLLAGKDQIDKKKGSEIFTQILYKWDAFMESSHEVLENYKKMSDEDQKNGKKK